MPQIYCYSDEVGLRSVPYGQAMTTIPGPNDDISSGWCDASLWQYVDSGVTTMYMCIDSTVGAAQWKAL